MSAHGDHQGEGIQYAPSLFERLTGGLAFIGAVASALLVVGTLVIVGYSVLMRYVIGTPVTWTDELSGYLVVAIVMLGAAETLRRNEHINVDLLSSRARGGLRRVLDVWAMIAVIAVALALVISATKMVRFSVDFEIYSEGYLETPMWIPQSFLLFGAGLLLVAAVARIISILLHKARPERDGAGGDAP